MYSYEERIRAVELYIKRGMLVSYRTLGDAEGKLAKALQIEVVAGAEIARPDERVRVWVS